MRLGFIGTGTMGNPMAQCLLDAGYRLGVHDIRREATTNLCERGADWFDNARDLAAASDVVLASLPGPPQVEQVMLDPRLGALSVMAEGSAFIDTTTNSPILVRRLAELCRAQGIDMLDCPVSMKPPNMTIMAGGDRQVFDKYLPVLEAMGRNIFYVGGADWFDNARDLAAASDVVLASLPGPPQVEQVMLDPRLGALSVMAEGSAFIDTTTNSPILVRRLAELCRAQGIDMLDCPVSMKPPNMTIMAGGDRQVFDKYLPVLEAMGRNIFYVGGSGQGCSAKLVTQYLGYSNFIAAAEGVLMAVKAGVDLEVLAEIVPVSAGASRAFQFFPQSVYPRDFPAVGSLDIVAKDLQLACQMARDMQTLCRVGDVADDIFKRAQAQGLGGLSFSAVVQVMEQMSGAEIRLDPD